MKKKGIIGLFMILFMLAISPLHLGAQVAVGGEE